MKCERHECTTFVGDECFWCVRLERQVLRARTQKLEDALRYAIEHERTHAFDFNEWYRLCELAGVVKDGLPMKKGDG